MKKKIVGLVMCVMLISCSTTLALTSVRNSEQQFKQQFSGSTPAPLLSPKGWIKIFGVFGEDCGYSVQQTDDGGYIIAGCNSQHRERRICLVN